MEFKYNQTNINAPNLYFNRSDYFMELSKKVLVALAILLTVSYGLSMAAAGVSIPGCGEAAP
ncbi:MAG: hypothetical protein EU529_09590 [Promethearchaeota archaeon]|nr:MAG: hypothetical protein EU529_09590 [Candidatus Lokiarchaeota archaeon]